MNRREEKSFGERQYILQQASRRYLAGEIPWVERRVISETHGPFRSHFLPDQETCADSSEGKGLCGAGKRQ